MILAQVTASLAFAILYNQVYLSSAPSFPRTLTKGLSNALLAITVLQYSDCPSIGVALALFAAVDVLTSRPNWSVIVAIGLNMSACFLSGLIFLNIIEQSGAQLSGLKIIVIILVAVTIFAMNVANWRHFGEKNVAIAGSSIVVFLAAAAGVALPDTKLLASIGIVLFVMSALPFMRETFAIHDLKKRLMLRRATWPLYYAGLLMIAVDFLPPFWPNPF